MERLHAMIMAGGAGTRFWPASRKARPKHFLPLAAGRSLIEATVERAADAVGNERVWIVTNAAQARLLPDILPDFPPERFVIEPEPRDTAPCVALATAWIESRDPGAAMAFMPADHLIEPQSAFRELLHRAADLAGDDQTLVTLGIRPDRPATGYGYIERGDPLPGDGAYRVRSFREKPDLDTARRLLEDGRFLWNSGLFVWTASAVLAAMQVCEPSLATCTRQMTRAFIDGDPAALERSFATAPKTSIDYAVMEKAPDVAVLEADLRWNDLGSFGSLGSATGTDPDGNAALLLDGAELIHTGARGCTVYADGPRTLALFGTEDLVVVAAGDALMICPRDRAEELKTLIEHLRSIGREDLL